jgi:hypothetical protein
LVSIGIFGAGLANPPYFRSEANFDYELENLNRRLGGKVLFFHMMRPIALICYLCNIILILDEDIIEYVLRRRFVAISRSLRMVKLWNWEVPCVASAV